VGLEANAISVCTSTDLPEFNFSSRYFLEHCSHAIPSSFIGKEPDHFSHKEWRHHHLTNAQHIHRLTRTSAFPNLIPATTDKQFESFGCCLCSTSFFIGFDSEFESNIGVCICFNFRVDSDFGLYVGIYLGI
jgi:hypothetical protein